LRSKNPLARKELARSRRRGAFRAARRTAKEKGRWKGKGPDKNAFDDQAAETESASTLRHLINNIMKEKSKKIS